MSELLDTAIRQIAAGQHKEALKTLWTVEGQSLRNAEDTRALIEVASSLCEGTRGRVQKEAKTLIRSGEANLRRLTNIDQQRGPQPHPGAVAFVPHCRVLGGHGLARANEIVELSFTERSLWLRHVVDNTEFEIPYDDVAAIEIGGPGARQRGGGFVGGGFGLQGAGEGMLIAAALNLLTTRTTVDTVICIQTRSAELFLHHGEIKPDALRIELSPVFTALRQRHAATPLVMESPGTAADQLEKLGDLLARGLITEEEFRRLKADIVN